MSRLRIPARVAGAALAFLVVAGAGADDADASPPASDTVWTSVAAGPVSFPGVYAFVDVNVVPMDRRRVLEHQTVLVRDGVIRTIADTGSVEIPGDAVRIRGNGRYLLPGLGDMYARLPGPDAAEGELEDLLFLYVAHGVTTIRQGTGQDGHRSLKRRLLRDQTLGPTLYLPSPPLSADLPPRSRTLSRAALADSAGLDSAAAAAVDSVEAAAVDSMAAAVERVAREGWDLLRVSEGLSMRAWDWMTEAVVRFGLPFGGPVPDSVGLRHALATGISTVDHLDGFIEAVVSDAYENRIDAAFGRGDTAERPDGGDGAGPLARDSTAERLPASVPPLDSLVRAVERRKIWAVAGRARAAGTWVIPTLRLSETLHRPVEPDSLLSLPEMRYVAPRTRTQWVRQKEMRPPTDSATARLLAGTRRAIVKALNDLDAGLLLGTDSPRMFNVPGFSIHREMRLMREAGIIPYEVLIAGTRNVARYASGELGESGSFGTVAEGHRADLILVEGNPLEDLDALQRRAGVMVRGRWLPESEIQSRLRAIAAEQGEF